MKLVFFVKRLTDAQKLALKSVMNRPDRYMVDHKDAVFVECRSNGGFTFTHGCESYAKSQMESYPSEYVPGAIEAVTSYKLVPNIPEYIMHCGHKYVLSKE